MTLSFYSATTGAMRLALRLLADWQVLGVEAVPLSGPLIIVANHIHFLDPPVLAASLPRKVAIMARDDLLRLPGVGLMVRGYDTIAVRRGSPDRRALVQAMTRLQGGGAVGIFPEGTRSPPQAGLGEGRPGAALLALRTAAPILPVGISGTRDLFAELAALRRPRVLVRIGSPFVLRRGERAGAAARADATQQIMARIAELLPGGAPLPAGI
ncbi:MAG: 1-acyl-sn-glycerol-3-phosphate acyltransferase [Chloroflexi bacterium]|nr:1-acyl-sn-glycerol-3-phosphate acyltransferase [Chloroflexota bacterium]